MSTYNMIQDMQDEIDNKIEEWLEDGQLVKPEVLGIDSLSCASLYVLEDSIAIKKRHRRTFDYYAGGEYVDEEFVVEIGNYVFYFSDDNRVERWIDRFNDEEEHHQE